MAHEQMNKTGNMFRWLSHDVGDKLTQHRPEWRQEILDVAANHAVAATVYLPWTTATELIVPDEITEQELPWFTELYEGAFRKSAEAYAIHEKVNVGQRNRFGIRIADYNPEMGIGEERAHTGAPIEGHLFLTTHTYHPTESTRHDGGMIMTSHDPRNITETAILVDPFATIIEPREGYAAYFDARRPHVVTGLRRPGPPQVSMVMQYFTASSPEQNIS